MVAVKGQFVMRRALEFSFCRGYKRQLGPIGTKGLERYTISRV